MLLQEEAPEGLKIGGRPAAGVEGWPAEVRLILSALEAGRAPRHERREHNRRPYHVRATLRLFSDPANTPPWLLYTRDVDSKGVGFVTPHRLPLGYGGEIELVLPNGRQVRVDCTLLRCRTAAPGWFEGFLYFNREQFVFAPATE